VPLVAAEHVQAECLRLLRMQQHVDRSAELDAAQPDRPAQQLVTCETPHRTTVLPGATAGKRQA
jgi:hypothetical protein